MTWIFRGENVPDLFRHLEFKANMPDFSNSKLVLKLKSLSNIAMSFSYVLRFVSECHFFLSATSLVPG